MLSDPGGWTRDELLAYLYDWEHDRFTADIDFYQSLAQRTGGPILELACGTGRVLEPLAHDGHQVVGLDRSDAMLRRARGRLWPAGKTATLVQGDVRGPLPSGPYSLAIFALDGLSHVHELDEQLEVLRQVGQVLLPGGLLVCDVAHGAAWGGEPIGTPILQESGYAEELDAEVTKWVVRRTWPARALLELLVFYDVVWSDRHFERITEVVSLHTFTRPELALLLRLAGYVIEGLFGDYELGPFVDDSERLIVLARPVSA